MLASNTPQQRLRILLVDDRRDHVELIRRAFTSPADQVHLVTVDDLKGARHAVRQAPPHVALANLDLPDGRGLDLLTLPGDSAAFPVIILANHGDERAAVEAIKAGAMDYVVKSDASLGALPQRVGRILQEWQQLQARRAAESRPRDGDAWLQQVIANIGDHIYVAEITTAGDAVNRYLSPNFQQLIGYPPEQLIDNWDLWWSRIHPADQHLAQRQRAQLADGQDSDSAYRLIHADGRIVWVRDRACVKRVNGASIVYGIVSDITERQKTETELQQYRSQLEALIVERTAEWESAAASAQAANRAKSKFLANMSHELRTPLNGILGYTQVLRRDPSLTARQQEILSIIQENGNHLLNLITDILDLGEIEARRMELQPAPLLLPEFLEEIARLIRARAEAKGLIFQYDAADPLPTAVLADRHRLNQVLINLLDNAVKFTTAGSVTLRVTPISAADRQPDRVVLRFEVSDTGIGIAPSQIDSIFHPFEQVDDRAQRAAGTGLGLAISRQLVHMMGGSLQVASRLDEGSSFWFHLMLPLTDELPSQPQESARQIIGHVGRRRRAVLAGDRQPHVLALGGLLESLGLEAILIDGSGSLPDRVAALLPDILLLNLAWLDGDGYETAVRLREQPALHQVPMIALAASPAGVNVDRGLEAGCSEVLSAPLTPQTVVRLLEQHLGLEWIYRDRAQLLSTEAAPAARNTAVPPHADMNHLLDLALRGDMHGIRRRAAELKTSNPGYAPFADSLIRLARRYDEQEVLALIRQNM